jgi:uncharacterized membrane protein
MFVFATGLSVVGYAGGITDAAGKGMWLALIGGLIVALPTAVTGFADWVTIAWGTPRWRTATLHLTAMLSAVALFALAAWRQYPGYEQGHVTSGGLVFCLAGFVVLTAGGWLGGTIVFVHGMRVLGRSDGGRGPTAAGTRDEGSGKRGAIPAGTQGERKIEEV